MRLPSKAWGQEQPKIENSIPLRIVLGKLDIEEMSYDDLNIQPAKWLKCANIHGLESIVLRAAYSMPMFEWSRTVNGKIALQSFVYLLLRAFLIFLNAPFTPLFFFLSLFLPLSKGLFGLEFWLNLLLRGEFGVELFVVVGESSSSPSWFAYKKRKHWMLDQLRIFLDPTFSSWSGAHKALGSTLCMCPCSS